MTINKTSQGQAQKTGEIVFNYISNINVSLVEGIYKRRMFQ